MTTDVVDDSADDEVDELLAAVAHIPPREPEWTPPAELDEYRLIRLLGRGGMGSVWLAEDRLLDRMVAVKFIAHAAPDERTRERFAIEARAAARLQHENVVTVHRYGEIAGRPYLVSEYIRGDSLDKLAKPTTWERALDIGIALARGLAAAHRHGIVHRDIKPANALLTADGAAKLVDFGLAKLDRHEVAAPAPSGTSALTQAGTVAGTPRYLAPEVRAGEPAGRRSDVYQIGCILYELVTGRAPIVDLRARQLETATAEDADTPASIETRELPALELAAAGRRFAAVVERCLRRDPEQRFASGDELRDALEQLAAPGRIDAELPEGNPYRGLLAFEAEHRALFFGRDGDIRAVVDRLRAESFVLVTGDSGAGKSSLCRAGVLPRITDRADDPWIVVSLVPGPRPLATLASLLAEELDLDEAALAATMRDEPTSVARELRRAADGCGLLVFVDQLEELSTVAERSEADAFARVLAELAAGVPGLRLLATVRSDFLTRAAELPAIGSDIARAIYLLRPLTGDGARAAIVGPARATGVRFESDELVDKLVGSTSELPLLAFTLAQLWDARDRETDTISARSLEAIGGVRGALARHADGVLDSLLPEQRRAARRLLLRLVTPERTRIRRCATELPDLDKFALDALVRGRLVVARGADDEPTFELAHERLIDGWPTLAGWIAETAEAHAAHARLATAVADWQRLQRSKDSLWNARRLADVARVAVEDLTPAEAEFVRASRAAARRRRWLRASLIAGVPLLALSAYAGARIVASRDLDRRIADSAGEADRVLVEARNAAADTTRLRKTAFSRFDANAAEEAERQWEHARQRSDNAQAAYTQAARALEAAFLLDTARDDIRRKLAQVTWERIELGELDHRDTSELASRLELYDAELAARLVTPATLTVGVTPPDASIAILGSTGTALALPFPPPPLPPGSYIVEASAPNHATVRYPVLLHRGEHAIVRFTLPPAASVPAGFVYVPPGTFLYGSADDEGVRRFFGTTPMHEVTTRAYLIGRTEVTYAQWIAFLDALPVDERKRRTPHVEESSTYNSSSVDLRQLPDGTRELHLAPSSEGYIAREGDPIVYKRTLRAKQDWRQMPVTGISSDDIRAYALWLDHTGRVPHARLCSEPEWERAARGADGRSYPHGEALAPDDANIDVTYGRAVGGFGPDVVGAHPASTSPFGLADMAGNVWERVQAADGTGADRGGCFYQDAKTARLANREAGVPAEYRNVLIGVRICASVE